MGLGHAAQHTQQQQQDSQRTLMLTVEYIFPAVAGDIGSTAAGDKLSLPHILTADPRDPGPAPPC